jgi:hypothetical protein
MVATTATRSAAKEEPNENLVVARRAFGKSLPERKKAVKAFQEGTKLPALAKQLGLTTVKAKYLVAQTMVELGELEPIEPTPAAIKKAKKAGADWDYLACQTGLSTGKLKRLAS